MNEDVAYARNTESGCKDHSTVIKIIFLNFVNNEKYFFHILKLSRGMNF